MRKLKNMPEKVRILIWRQHLSRKTFATQSCILMRTSRLIHPSSIQGLLPKNLRTDHERTKAPYLFSETTLSSSLVVQPGLKDSPTGNVTHLKKRREPIHFRAPRSERKLWLKHLHLRRHKEKNE